MNEIKSAATSISDVSRCVKRLTVVRAICATPAPEDSATL